MTACSPQSGAAYRRYLRRFIPATGAYVVAIGLATWLIPDDASASVWGILELYTDVPRLPVFFIFPLWCGGLVVGQLWNRIAGA